MRLFASVGADVPGLVLQAIEGLVTKRAFIGTVLFGRGHVHGGLD